jgi:hypothetical protein
MLAAVLLVTASCTNDDLDDGTSADVILEIMSLENPPITAQLSQSTQGTCEISGTICDSSADCADDEVCIRQQLCELEVEDWTVSIMAAPKNPLATTPFNDIVVTHVDITYVWEDPSIDMSPNSFGLGNVTIPAQTTSVATFPPISSDALMAYDVEGKTAHLTLQFHARTVEGTSISTTTRRPLIIEVCN